MLPNSIKNFADLFSSLPSIGPRQAVRLAFYLITGGRNKVYEIGKALMELSKVKICAQCFFTFEPEDQTKTFCSICSNPDRRRDVVAIVEKETDLMSLEKTKKFIGRYLVIGSLKKDAVFEGYQKARLETLKKSAPFEEVIIATNLTTYGDLHASLISQELKDLSKKITRLGRGIPTGGEIEFADEETLGAALDRRV